MDKQGEMILITTGGFEQFYHFEHSSEACKEGDDAHCLL